MMMLMIRKKLSHRCFWWNINCCARGGLFQAIPEDGDGDDDDGTGRWWWWRGWSCWWHWCWWWWWQKYQIICLVPPRIARMMLTIRKYQFLTQEHKSKWSCPRCPASQLVMWTPHYQCIMCNVYMEDMKCVQGKRPGKSDPNYIFTNPKYIFINSPSTPIYFTTIKCHDVMMQQTYM